MLCDWQMDWLVALLPGDTLCTAGQVTGRRSPHYAAESLYAVIIFVLYIFHNQIATCWSTERCFVRAEGVVKYIINATKRREVFMEIVIIYSYYTADWMSYLVLHALSCYFHVIIILYILLVLSCRRIFNTHYFLSLLQWIL